MSVNSLITEYEEDRENTCKKNTKNKLRKTKNWKYLFEKMAEKHENIGVFAVQEKYEAGKQAPEKICINTQEKVEEKLKRRKSETKR